MGRSGKFLIALLALTATAFAGIEVLGIEVLGIEVLGIEVLASDYPAGSYVEAEADGLVVDTDIPDSDGYAYVEMPASAQSKIVNLRGPLGELLDSAPVE